MSTYSPAEVVTALVVNTWDDCAHAAYHYAKAVAEGRVDASEIRTDLIVCQDEALEALGLDVDTWDRGIAGVRSLARGNVENLDTGEVCNPEPIGPGYDSMPVGVYPEDLDDADVTLVEYAAAMSEGSVVDACRLFVTACDGMGEIVSTRATK